MKDLDELFIEAANAGQSIGCLMNSSDVTRYYNDVGSRRGILDGSMSPAEAKRRADALGLKLSD